MPQRSSTPHPVRVFAGLASAAVSLCLLGCNPFLGNYSGERWPEVAAARVVMDPPSPETARWIGRSDFTTTGHYGDAAALEAARRVGADLVEWHDRDLGATLSWTSEPAAIGGWRGSAFGFGPDRAWADPVVDMPVPIVEQEDRYQARFYRSKSLGGEPRPGAGGLPASSPPSMVPPLAASSSSPPSRSVDEGR